MPGTVAGGKLTAKKLKEQYGEDYYSKIGKVGGRNGRTGCFYVNRELARVAGAKGGSISKRAAVKKFSVYPFDKPVVLVGNLVETARFISTVMPSTISIIKADLSDLSVGDSYNIDEYGTAVRMI